MGLFDFVKDAGAKIFGGGDDEAEPERGLDDVLADKAKGKSLSRVLVATEIPVEDLHVAFREGRATLKGTVNSQADREKLVLLAGNTHGVAQVDDQLHILPTAAASAETAPPGGPQATMYTVQSGDSLSKIAKAQYGDAMKYMVIFEANTPMLKDPNKIYPGQVLRIPPLEPK